MGVIEFLEETTPTAGSYDISGIVDGLQSGVSTLVSSFVDMVGSMLPTVMPILAVSVGLGFCIGLVRRFI